MNLCQTHTTQLLQTTGETNPGCPHIHVQLYLNSGELREKQPQNSVTAADTHWCTFRLKVWTEEVLERFTGDVITQKVIIEWEVCSFRWDLHWAGDQLRTQVTFSHPTQHNPWHHIRLSNTYLLQSGSKRHRYWQHKHVSAEIFRSDLMITFICIQNGSEFTRVHRNSCWRTYRHVAHSEAVMYFWVKEKA